MSPIPYIDLAALLIEGSTVVSPDDRCGPEETVEAIMDALSLTQLREHILLHLTIDNWAVDYEQPPADLTRKINASKPPNSAEICHQGELMAIHTGGLPAGG